MTITIEITRTRLVALIMALVLVAPATAFAASVFDDVPEDAFYAAPVEWAADNGITTGKSPTTFAPLDLMNRAEGVTFLQRYENNVVAPRSDARQAQIDALIEQTEALAQDADLLPRVYFARVAADGTIEHDGQSDLAVERVGDGDYLVTLPEAADNCVLDATFYASADIGGELLQRFGEYRGPAASVFAIRWTEQGPNDIRVFTHEDDGGNEDLTDLPFAFTAICAYPGGAVGP